MSRFGPEKACIYKLTQTYCQRFPVCSLFCFSCFPSEQNCVFPEDLTGLFRVQNHAESKHRQTGYRILSSCHSVHVYYSIFLPICLPQKSKICARQHRYGTVFCFLKTDLSPPAVPNILILHNELPPAYRHWKNGVP